MNTMKPKLVSLLAAALVALTIALPACFTTGCAMFGDKPPATVIYHTLKDTQIIVDNGMKHYADRCVLGLITSENQAKVDAAHGQYRAAFREAVTLAQLDYTKLTPDNVEALANTLLKIIAGL